MSECKHLMNSDTCISCSDDIKKIRTAEEIVSYYDLNNWEEVPDEDLWEDGEIDENGLTLKLFQQIITEGEWKVIRRTNDTID